METIYDTLCTTVDALCSLYRSAGVRRITFGHSYLGREIPAIQLGEGSHRLLYLGRMTGSIRTGALLLRFVCDYAQAVQSGLRVAGIDISYLQHTRSITVVPVLNVDGAVLRCDGTDDKNPLLARLLTMRAAEQTAGDTDASDEAEHPFVNWVCNGRGVDLRCNFDAEFTTAMTRAHGIGGAGFPGMHPESEPECAAAANYLRSAATTDLALIFGDGADEDAAVVSKGVGRISWSGFDHRTRSLAQILARDIDGRGYETDSVGRCGSIGSWYRGMHAGPLLNITLPQVSAQKDEGGAVICAGECSCKAHLHALLGHESTSPGDTLARAELALQYGKLRKMLFHGAVL